MRWLKQCLEFDICVLPEVRMRGASARLVKRKDSKFTLL